jgi:CTP-dependent riboflavin kinase
MSVITVQGIIVRGHEVASKASEYYPKGTIEMQTPFFKDRGLDLTAFYCGTLNISIHPERFRVKNAEYKFPQVAWTSKHPPEDFSFSRCRILHNNRKYSGWIYYPHPETKIRHHQNLSVVEVIAPLIPKIKYGDRVEVEMNSMEIEVY